MSERLFVAGDVVRHKSGGPLMTVYSAYRGEVFTRWFDAHNVLHDGRFTQAELILN